MQARLSQQTVAERIGVSKVTISELERGHMRLDLEYLRRIAHALDVTPIDLLPRCDNPEALSIEERQLIERLRAASPDQRDQLQRVADVIVPYKPEIAEPRWPRKAGAK